MKISKETIDLLQHFANINAGIIIEPGSKLAIRNASNSVQARATVPEVFPTKIAIYDLSPVLNILSFPDSEVEFGEKSLVISSPLGRTVYNYADESLIKTPSIDPPKMDVKYSFTLGASDISAISKIGAIISATTITITGKKGVVTLTANDPKNKSSNMFEKTLGKCDSDFVLRVNHEMFKVVPDSYTVSVALAHTKKEGTLIPVLFLESTTRKASVLIGADPASKI